MGNEVKVKKVQPQDNYGSSSFIKNLQKYEKQLDKKHKKGTKK